jgi:FSR family fosmidomycin resistance protein-like MFS transporter
MAGGGLGRTLGPLLVVWAVGVWGLEGTYRLMLIGWAASLILFLQLKKIDIHPQKASSFSIDFHKFKSFFLPLTIILVLRNFLLASISTYLPTYLRQNGSPLWIAGASLSALEVSGVIGALLMGSLSDVIGRKKILIPAMLISSLTLFGFLNTSGWKMIPFLIILGMSSKSTGTIFLALVQDQFKIHRATGNGIYMLISFLTNAGMLLLIGIIGDAFGLRFAYYIAIITSLCTMPALLLLPENKVKPDGKTSN